MVEVTAEAIVLDKEDLGEYDSRVFLYTKELGKISAKAVSLRKITSKLAGQVEPLNQVAVRLISRDNFGARSNYNLIDALATEAGWANQPEDLKRKALSVLNFVKNAVPDGNPDQELWDLLLEVVRAKTSLGSKELLNFFG